MARSATWPRCCRCFCRRARAAKRFRSTSGCGAVASASLAAEEERYTRLKQWVGELATDERLAFFKLITGELRVGVSRLQVVKALAEIAGVDEGRMAQRLIGYSQARRIPTAADFEALIGEVLHAEAQALDAGKPYPFYLAQSWSRPLAEMLATLGPPSNWIIEWKYDGIRAQLLKRGENWRLWSRGEELISDAYPDLEPLARALPSGAAIDGELVVLIPPEHEFATDSLDGLAIFASLQQRLGRKIVSEKTMRELPVAFIAYDLLESEGRDLRTEPQHVRRALLEQLVDRLFTEARARGERLPIRISPTVSADTWEELAEKREQARALTREGLMLKAREGAYGDRPPQGRRPHGRVVEMEARPDERRRRRDLCRARPRPPLGRLHRLHFRRLERGRRGRNPRARAVRQGLFGADGQGNSRDGRDHPPHHGRDLRSGAQSSPRRRSSSSASKASRRASATRAASPFAFPACCAGAATSRSPRPTRWTRSRRCWRGRAGGEGERRV